MILYFLNGENIKALYNDEVYANQPDVSEYDATFNIDEIPENQALCKDIWWWSHHKDENGLSKYYLSNGQLNVRDNWIGVVI